LLAFIFALTGYINGGELTNREAMAGIAREMGILSTRVSRISNNWAERVAGTGADIAHRRIFHKVGKAGYS